MTRLFHITHVANLPGIIAAGGLWCDAMCAARGATVVGIAHQHIKDRRAAKRVRVAVGGTLADYVPFYFAPEVCALTTPWAFTDGHADMEISNQFADLADLRELDWNLMREEWWRDTV